MAWVRVGFVLRRSGADLSRLRQKMKTLLLSERGYRSYFEFVLEVLESRQESCIRGVAPAIVGENIGGGVGAAGADQNVGGGSSDGAPDSAVENGGGETDDGEPEPRWCCCPSKAPRSDRISIALARFDQLPSSAFVRLPVVQGLLDCSAASVWRYAKSGKLPQPVKLTAGTTAWQVGPLRRALADFVLDAQGHAGNGGAA